MIIKIVNQWTDLIKQHKYQQQLLIVYKMIVVYARGILEGICSNILKANVDSSNNNVNNMSSSGSITSLHSHKSNRSNNNNDDNNNKERITTNQLKRGMRSLSTSNRVISRISPSSNNTILRQQQNPRLNTNPHLRITSSTKTRATLDSQRRRGIQIPLPLLPQHLFSQSSTSNNRLSSPSSSTNICPSLDINSLANDELEPRDNTLPDSINIDRDNNGLTSNEIISNANKNLASVTNVSKKYTSTYLKRIHTCINCGKHIGLRPLPCK